MKLFSIIFLFLILACAKKEEANTSSESAEIKDVAASSTHFGSVNKLENVEAIGLIAAINQNKLNQDLRIKAQVLDVCQKKGCWMVLKDGEKELRVTFKDYGFFMPKDLSGKQIILEGSLTEEIVKEETLRHYAEDAGKTKEEIEKIKGDQKGYTIVASSVDII